MANWTGLAGAAGLAAALEEIQSRRVREGELQRKLTEGQGEWTPATGGMGGPLGFFDALFGYNKPGQIGFGGQRYQFQPHPRMTEEDVRGLGLTMPQTTTTPAYEKPLPPNVQGPLELVPEQTTTRDVPLPGFVGARLDPKTRQSLALERFKEHRDLAKLREEYRLAGMGLEPGGAGVQEMRTPAFVIPGTEGATPALTTGAASATQPPVVPGGVPGIDKLSPQFRAKAQMIANRLGVNLDDFYRVMHFETGGEFSPATKNRAGSGATGLIQFTEETAKGLGTTTAALAQMTPEQQLDYVEKHLAPHKGKMGNLKDLFMAVLYPAAVGKSEDTVLFTPDKTPVAYRQNAGLDTGKKGFVTVGDAVAAVQRTTGSAPTAVASAPGPGAQAQVPAPAPGDTGMQVAGPGAPAPPTGASTPEQDAAYRSSVGQPPPPGASAPATVQVAPTKTETGATAPSASGQAGAGYTPSPALVAQVNNNKQQMAANDQRIMQLEQERRMAQVGVRRNMPGAVDRLRMYSDQQESLRKQNAVLRKEAEDAYTKEYGAWQQTQTKVGEEGRKPPLEADVKTAVQDAEISEPLRETKFDLVSTGQAPDKPWKDYTSQEKALVQRTHSERKQEATNIEKMNEWERTALFQITKDEGTPQGRATKEQLARARGIGRQNEIAFEQQKKIALGEATLDVVMGENDALRWINPQTRQPATNMTPRQAKDAGYMLMAKPQQDTLKNGYNSIQYVSRLNTLYFGGVDQDGSITGQAGTKFEGIYPWVERTRKETQTLGARASQTAAVRTGLLQGKTMAQWARVADNFIDASLGAISRDLGGERGHFTDIDAQRARKFFTNFGSGWWGKTLGDPNLMRSSGEAKDMMGLVAGVISDRVRGALDLDPGDPLPWNIQGNLLPKSLPPEQRRQRGAPATGPSTPATGQTQESVPATGTPAAAQEPAPTPTTTQETAPAPTTGAAPKKLDGPTAQRLLNEATQALFPGRAPASLSEGEVAQARARAREMWQQQGGK